VSWPASSVTRSGPWCRWTTRRIRAPLLCALSTMVVNGTQVKLYAWYDNEWGYANRTAELMRKVGRLDRAG
jgi:glyceraldehyde-3-phosphate dehydrogenase/erythrose-4-phosphate dehydrogenase